MVFLARPPGTTSNHNGHRHNGHHLISAMAHRHALGNEEQEHREQQRQHQRMQQMAATRSHQLLHKHPHFLADVGSGGGMGTCRRCLRRNGPIHETCQGGVQICVDSPGVKAEDINITVHDNVIRIQGSRKHDIAIHHNHGHNHSTSTRMTHHQYSSFCRTFAMDNNRMDLNSIKANLADGVLIVTVDKKKKNAAVNSSKNHNDPINDTSSPQVDMHHHKIDIQRGSCEPQQHQGSEMRLHVDVPGIKAEDLSVETDSQNYTISIQGKRTIHPSLNVHKRYVLDQHRIDLSAVQAFLQDGVLTLLAPLLPSTTVASKLALHKIVVTDHPHQDCDHADDDDRNHNTGSEEQQQQLDDDSTIDLTTSSDDGSNTYRQNNHDQQNGAKASTATTPTGESNAIS